MTVEFKQISNEKNSTERFVGMAFGIYALIMSVIIFVSVKQNIVNNILTTLIIIVLSIFLWKRMRKLLPDWVKQNEIIGIVTISFNSIISQSFKIEASDVKKLNIHHNYIQDQNYARKDITHNGISTWEVITANNQSKTFKFLIENKKQLEVLKLVLLEFYKRRIEIKEEFGNYKMESQLYVVHPTYEQYQELKKEIKNSAANNGYK